MQLDPTPAIPGEFGYIAPVSPEEYAAQERAMREQLASAFPGVPLRTERAGSRAVWQTILDMAREEKASTGMRRTALAPLEVKFTL